VQIDVAKKRVGALLDRINENESEGMNTSHASKTGMTKNTKLTTALPTLLEQRRSLKGKEENIFILIIIRIAIFKCLHQRPQCETITLHFSSSICCSKYSSLKLVGRVNI